MKQSPCIKCIDFNGVLYQVKHSASLGNIFCVTGQDGVSITDTTILSNIQDYINGNYTGGLISEDVACINFYGSGGYNLFKEKLDIITTNIVPDTTKDIYDIDIVTIIINGISYFSGATNPVITATAPRSVIFSSTNAGFDLESTDVVEIEYLTITI